MVNAIFPPIEVIYNLDSFAMTKSYQDGGLLAWFR